MSDPIQLATIYVYSDYGSLWDDPDVEIHWVVSGYDDYYYSMLWLAGLPSSASVTAPQVEDSAAIAAALGHSSGPLDVTVWQVPDFAVQNASALNAAYAADKAQADVLLEQMGIGHLSAAQIQAQFQILDETVDFFVLHSQPVPSLIMFRPTATKRANLSMPIRTATSPKYIQ